MMTIGASGPPARSMNRLTIAGSCMLRPTITSVPLSGPCTAADKDATLNNTAMRINLFMSHSPTNITPRQGSLLEHLSALHHELHLAKRLEVCRWIAVNGDQIREQPLLDASNALGLPEIRGIAGGGGDQRGRRRHAVVDHDLELAH